jgi:serine/threonine protein kinase
MDRPPQENPGARNNEAVNSDEIETIAFDPTREQTMMHVGGVLNDRYLIMRELSSGGFGKVFLAQDQQLHNRPVVVKIQLERAVDDPWFEKKFSEELKALALIDHPGVVGALDSGRTPDGRPFLVMQYIEGHSLRSVITSDGLPLDRAAHIIRQIGQALAAAHNKNIWHRDLKPENIMLQVLPGGDEHVRVIDFGLATIADIAARQQSYTRVAGTVGYMAPEQFTGQPSASTDIYAFGVIAYEMIAGRKPFVASDAVQLNLLQQTGVKVKPSALRPGISEKTERLILHALQYNPKDRPLSASALGDALSQALLGSQPMQSIQMEAMRKQRVRFGWWAGGCAAVLALGLGGLWIYRGRSSGAAVEPPKQVSAAVAPVASLTSSSSDDAVEVAFWNSIGSSGDARLYREYLTKFPNGKFASLAKLKLEAPKAKPASPDSAAQVPTAAGAFPPPEAKDNLPPPRPPVKLSEYSGPNHGNLVWSGNLAPGATLTIQGGVAESGRLIGDLPRVPVVVELLAGDASVMQQPAETSRWDRLVLRNTGSTPLRGLVARWRVTR